MIIGIPKEIKKNENRVSITPAGVHEYIKNGHEVLIEKSAGICSGITDHEYEKEGANIIKDASTIFKNAEMICKVKEPQPAEIELFHEGQVIYTYLHLAASKELTLALLDKKIVGVAYETIEENNKLPLLEPMSEVAGKVAGVMAAYFLAKTSGGSGVLPGGVAGVHSANYLILGGGTAGINAAKVAAGLGARVVVMDINLERMRYLEDVLPKNCEMIMSNKINIEKEAINADTIIGTVLIPGAKAPKLIRRKLLSKMKPGSVIVDVAIDQGGCAETSHPTTHADPVFIIDNIVHYCVANIPGAYPKSSTYALTNATLPYGLKLANHGWEKAAHQYKSLAYGINLAHGKITHPEIARAHNLNYHKLNKKE